MFLRDGATALALAADRLAWLDVVNTTLWVFDPDSGGIKTSLNLLGSGMNAVAIHDDAYFIPSNTNDGFRVDRINFDGTNPWTYTEEPGNTDPEIGLYITVVDGRVYVPTDSAEGAPFTVLDMDDGTELWTHNTGIDGAQGPAVDGNNVYVIDSSTQEIISFNAPDGSVNWRTNLTTTASSPPCTDGTNVYLSDDNGNLEAYDVDDGTQSWSVSPFSGTALPPAVADGVVYFMESSTGAVEARAIGDGGQVWNNTANGGGVSTPAIAGDHVYVQDGDNGLRAYNRFHGAVEWVLNVTGGNTGGANIIATPGSLYLYTESGAAGKVVEG